MPRTRAGDHIQHLCTNTPKILFLCLEHDTHNKVSWACEQFCTSCNTTHFRKYDTQFRRETTSAQTLNSYRCFQGSGTPVQNHAITQHKTLKGHILNMERHIFFHNLSHLRSFQHFIGLPDSLYSSYVKSALAFNAFSVWCHTNTPNDTTYTFKAICAIVRSQVIELKCEENHTLTAAVICTTFIKKMEPMPHIPHKTQNVNISVIIIKMDGAQSCTTLNKVVSSTWYMPITGTARYAYMTRVTDRPWHK